MKDMDYIKTFKSTGVVKLKTCTLLKYRNSSISTNLYKSKPWLCSNHSFFSIEKNNLYNQGINKRVVKVYSQSTDVDVYVFYITKMTFLFTFFYCSLQWFYYRSIRKDAEKNDDS
jgi:hypothetical protein